MPKNDRADLDKEIKRHATIVCVTDQYSCDTHIHAGRALADLTDTDLIVVHVASPADVGDAATIEYLYGVARQNGALMQMLYDDNPGKTLIKYVKRSKVRSIVTGQPEGSDAVPMQLWNKFTHIAFFVADGTGNLSAVRAPRRRAQALAGGPKPAYT